MYLVLRLSKSEQRARREQSVLRNVWIGGNVIVGAVVVKKGDQGEKSN
jgi:hypothetical protein